MGWSQSLGVHLCALLAVMIFKQSRLSSKPEDFLAVKAVLLVFTGTGNGKTVQQVEAVIFKVKRELLVTSHSLRLCHIFFGAPGALNNIDIFILPLFFNCASHVRLILTNLHCDLPLILKLIYSLCRHRSIYNPQEYVSSWILPSQWNIARPACPSWNPLTCYQSNPSGKLFSHLQDAERKDIEKCFRVL